jgi:hypothetical protein
MGGENMRKIFLAVFLVLAMMSTQAFALGDLITTNNIPTAISAPVTTNVNTNTNANLNTNLNTQGQLQGQGQIQGQGQRQTAVGKVNTKVSNNTSINNPREAIFAPAIPNAQLIIGEVGKYTLLPKFANSALVPYKGEAVVSILYASYGNIFSRITVDELTAFLLDKGAQFDGRKDVRYDVICKKASHGLALGTGGSVANTGADGNTSGGGVLGASGAWSVADPYCFVEFYEVK